MIERFGSRPKDGDSTLKDILTRHTVDYLMNGAYRTWIEVNGRACIIPDGAEQEELDRFAVGELPLGAVTRKSPDRRYRGFDFHYLVKADPDTGERVKLGLFGSEIVIVAITDPEGAITEIEEHGHRVTPYTQEQVDQVVQNAEELVSAGFPPIIKYR